MAGRTKAGDAVYAENYIKSLLFNIDELETRTKQLRAQIQRIQPVVDAAVLYCKAPCHLTRVKLTDAVAALEDEN